MMMAKTSKLGHLRYEDTDLDEESWRIVKAELKETEENKIKCMNILKKKLLDKEDLNANLNDTFLLAFLRITKYDCDKAYKRIIKLYEDKRNMPDVFGEYLPSSVEVVKDARSMYLSPYRMKKDNSAVIIWKRGYYDPSKHPYELIIRYVYLALEWMLQEKLNQMCGVTLIIDLKSMGGNSWAEITPARLKLTARMMQNTGATRIRGIHVINAPTIYYFFYSILYPFLSAKMRNRMHLHKNCASLHACIDPEILPREYEGQLEKADLIDVFEKIRENEEYFEKVSKFGFNEKKN